MGNPASAPKPAFQIQPFYSFSELGRAIGKSRWAIRAWVLKSGVRTAVVGGVIVVPLVALRDSFPDVWDSLLEAYALTGGAVECPACGAELEV